MKIKAILVESNKKARVIEIENTLESFQFAVGGYIECIYPFEDEVGIVCNEEGKFNGSEPNRALNDDDGNIYDIIFGTFIITGLTEDNFGSLSDELCEKYLERFLYPEVFMKTAAKIYSFKVIG